VVSVSLWTVVTEMRINVVTLPVNGEYMTVSVDAELENYQHLVGGYIQALYHKDWIMYCNEEGKLLDLPINEVATLLCHQYQLISPFDAIMGSVFFVGMSDESGHEQELSPQARVELIGEIVQIRQDINQYFDGEFARLIEQIQGG
jgi:hypothetical protein